MNSIKKEEIIYRVRAELSGCSFFGQPCHRRLTTGTNANNLPLIPTSKMNRLGSSQRNCPLILFDMALRLWLAGNYSYAPLHNFLIAISTLRNARAQRGLSIPREDFSSVYQQSSEIFCYVPSIHHMRNTEMGMLESYLSRPGNKNPPD